MPMAVTVQDRESLLRNFTRFVGLSPEDRLLHFDWAAKDMCSDEWREKFRTLLSKDRPVSDKNLLDEIFTHSQLAVLDPSQVTGCHACRSAFWKLVYMAT